MVLSRKRYNIEAATRRGKIGPYNTKKLEPFADTNGDQNGIQ